jgi:hypothetical protein
MPIEYEYAFQNFNKNNIISKLKNLKGKYKGTFLFRVQQFNPPTSLHSSLHSSLHRDRQYNQYNQYNIRVRDEEYRITMAVKTPAGEFDNEEEMIIDDFDAGVNYLIGLGCTPSVYYEKIREIWNINDTEIVFDYEDGSPDIMEIESPTHEELEKMVNMFFKLDKKNRFFTNLKNIFTHLRN